MLASTVPRHGWGGGSRSSSCLPATPNRSVTGQGCPNVISVEWIRFFSVDLWLTRCIRNRACSRRLRTPGPGSQICGTRSRSDSTASTRASILSVLHANGARPLTFCASAISTSQPNRSSVSCTNRAPVIDSITPCTGSPNFSTRRARPATPSPSLGVANCATSSPPSASKQTSMRLRLKSKPACNIEVGLLELAPRRTPGACHRGGPPSSQSQARARGSATDTLAPTRGCRANALTCCRRGGLRGDRGGDGRVGACLRFGSGRCGLYLVPVELEGVVGGGDHPPFRAHGGSSAALEAVNPAVELRLGEH